jgi:hypothetical protein
MLVQLNSAPVPATARKLTIPHARLLSVLLRTAHLLVISVLVGAHAYNAPKQNLLPLLYVAIVSGVGMAFIEAFPTASKLAENWALLLYLKLGLLCVIPFAWNYRFPILLVVVAIASLTSHMTRKLRHGSPFRSSGAA